MNIKFFATLANRLSAALPEPAKHSPTDNALPKDIFRAFNEYRSVQKELIKLMNQSDVKDIDLKNAIETVDQKFNKFKWLVRPVFYKGTEQYSYKGASSKNL